MIIRAWAEHDGEWNGIKFVSACVVATVVIPDDCQPDQIETAKRWVAARANNQYDYITVNEKRHDMIVPRFFINALSKRRKVRVGE